jgi:16S rRNA (guanine1516-N2)-methyltransferase
MKRGHNPVIWDATAGLGRDAFVLASLGAQVTLCERSPVLTALLDQALLLASTDADIGGWIKLRMHLVHGDSSELLASLPFGQKPEVVYLDPMYPPGKSAVLVKKEMRALQQLLGQDPNSEQLLDIALAAATRRVVVKRPRRAGWLYNRQPDSCIESKKTRYDVYMTNQQSVTTQGGTD